MRKSSANKRNQRMMDDNLFWDCKNCVNLIVTDCKKERHWILLCVQNDIHAKMPLRQDFSNEQQGKISTNMNLSSLSIVNKLKISNLVIAIVAFKGNYVMINDWFSVDGKYTNKLLWYG